MSVTVKIDDSSEAAKAFIDFVKSLSYAKIVSTREKQKYDPDFVKKVKLAEKRGDYKEVNPEDVWGSLQLK